MGLESGTFISDLVVTNPPTTDAKQQGDDHLRLIKTVLKNTFPTASKAIYFPTSVVKTANFSILATDQYTIFLVNTTSSGIGATLPTLVVSDAGWECSFVKTNNGTNPILIAPASGTIQSGSVSGLASTRRCIPGVRSRVMWTGSSWIAERAIQMPVGSIIEYAGVALPVGYEWPNGQTLLSAANYPDYNAIRGGLTTPDRRGRFAAGRDDMGGSAAGRLTGLSGGVNGVTFEGTGGEQAHTTTVPELPAHNHTATATDSGHTHGLDLSFLGPSGGGLAFIADPQVTADRQTLSGQANITVNVANAGGGGAHNTVPPVIIENFILVVE